MPWSRARFAPVCVALAALTVAACGDDGGGSTADTADTAQADGADATAPDDTGGDDATTPPDTATPDADADADAPDDTVDDTADTAVVDTSPPDEPPLSWVPHVRGDFNDWGTTDPLAYVGGGVYQATVAVPAGRHELKVADASWTLTTIFSASGSEQLTEEVGVEFPLVSAQGYNNNTVIEFADEGEHTFTLTVAGTGGAQSLSLLVTKGGGGSTALPDDSQVETFGAQTVTPVAVSPGTERVLGRVALFDALKIAIPAGESAQWVLGDNLDGYYEGWTHSYTTASRYRNKVGYLFAYFASLVDGALNDQSAGSTTSDLLPTGVRVQYGGGVWDELVVHSGQRALTLRVHSDTPGKLAVAPKLALKRASSSWERVGDAMVLGLAESLRQEGSPAFVGIAADKAHTYVGADLAALPALRDVAGILPTDVKPLITTTGDETDLRVVLAFAMTKEEAAAQALALAQVDSAGRAAEEAYALLTRSWLWTGDAAYDRALAWSKIAAHTMLVSEFGRGIWAGLPWFKDNWGRDTFIALPGTLLATGLFDDAKAVVRNFAALQNTDAASEDYGRIPNRVRGADDIIYNTTDGTPWMVREIEEIVRYTGDGAFATEMYPVVARYLDGAIAHHVDDDGFLTHDDQATWMDAAFGTSGEHPWSARGNRAVEIQALWYGALRYGARLAAAAGETAREQAWDAQADALESHFAAAFWDAGAHTMADRVRADGSRDTKMRPNQLMLLSIPLDDARRLVADDVEAHVARAAAAALLYPYGVASLAQTHPYFHPFHDHQARYEKDAAYHNGTVWGWNAGFAVTALARVGAVERAWALTKNLAGQITDLGARGTMSELLDAHPAASGALTPSGTYAQAWSVAEFTRNGYQDYLGVRPDLGRGALVLEPSPPASWAAVGAEVPLGAGGRLTIDYTRESGSEVWVLAADGLGDVATRVLLLGDDGARYLIALTLSEGGSRRVQFDPATHMGAIDRGPMLALDVARASQAAIVGELTPVTPNTGASFPTLEQQDYLRGVIERGEFE